MMFSQRIWLLLLLVAVIGVVARLFPADSVDLEIITGAELGAAAMAILLVPMARSTRVMVTVIVALAVALCVSATGLYNPVSALFLLVRS